MRGASFLLLMMPTHPASSAVIIDIERMRIGENLYRQSGCHARRCQRNSREGGALVLNGVDSVIDFLRTNANLCTDDTAARGRRLRE